jgi:LPXTG-site transpeptidase (sortase) family protein
MKLRYYFNSLGVIGIIILGITATYPLTRAQTIPIAVFELAVSPPSKLVIERLGISAPIQTVGISVNGAMGVPSNPASVGWYDQGPKPGETGSAVLAGHVNWDHNKPAIFANLDQITIGDIIEVYTIAEVQISFRVVDIKQYSIHDSAHAVFFSSDSLHRLNIITCSGIWDELLGTHNSRLVVFSEQV